jgi:hypothetical protein
MKTPVSRKLLSVALQQIRAASGDPHTAINARFQQFLSGATVPRRENTKLPKKITSLEQELADDNIDLDLDDLGAIVKSC